MSDEIESKLRALGRALEARTPAVTADEVLGQASVARLESARRRPRRVLVFASAAGACFVAGVGTSAALNTLTGDEVARGLPGAATIFEGTGPECEPLESDLYLCRLDRAPAAERVAADEEFEDPIAVFVDDEQIVTGGCAVVTVDRMHWLCAAGRRSIDYGYVSAALLGTRLPGVGVG